MSRQGLPCGEFPKNLYGAVRIEKIPFVWVSRSPRDHQGKTRLALMIMTSISFLGKTFVNANNRDATTRFTVLSKAFRAVDQDFVAITQWKGQFAMLMA